MDAATEQSNAPAAAEAAPARTGACPFCAKKHILKARGYARELAEDPSREWEADNLLENLMLAEDHALALGDESLRAQLRAVRHAAEEGRPDAARVDAVYARFKERYFRKGSPAKGEPCPTCPKKEDA